jgi:hypothetical protein
LGRMFALGSASTVLAAVLSGPVVKAEESLCKDVCGCDGGEVKCCTEGTITCYET